ncbi:MAG: hypothetical protein HYU66_25050 [Armatimonadetes bacterium]|nr:hypothetical protein [Armatimonadota bacterium]
MPSFLDRFRDLDDLKARAEDLWGQTVREGRRQAALAQCRVRVKNLELRMHIEFRTLGERVWELHQEGTLSTESLEGAWDRLEKLARDIEEEKGEIEELMHTPDDDEGEAPAPAEEPPAAPESGDEAGEGERKIENNP